MVLNRGSGRVWVFGPQKVICIRARFVGGGITTVCTDRESPVGTRLVRRDSVIRLPKALT